MSIERTAINNGNITELYNKLLTYVNTTPDDGKFFKSVSMANSIITCTDWNDDIVFKVTKSNSSAWSYDAPRRSTHAYSTWSNVKNMPSSPLSAHPIAVYTVGKSAFCIELAYGTENNHIGLVVIGKDSKGDTGSFYPLLNASNAGYIPDSYSVYSKHVNIPYTNGTEVATVYQVSMYGGVPIGNITCIAHASTIGSMNEYIDLNTVYVSRFLQSGIYGKTRIVTGQEQGTFLTNGLVFIKDDGD